MKRFSLVEVAIVAMVFLTVSLGAASFFVHHNTQEIVVATVTDKDIKTSRDSEGNVNSRYLIFTDSETFENTDSLWAMKFNSSDVYGRIREGERCKFTVVGFRVPFLSMYRNILEAECEQIISQ